MNRRHRIRAALRAALLAAVALGLVRCSDSTGPDVRDPADLNILRLPADHPPFFNTEVTRWIKPGQSAEWKLYFQDQTGGQGEEWAVLKIDSQSLLAKPDGSAFGPNDSVLVTLRVADQREVIVELLPSGLRFRSDKAAELKLDYDEVGDDLDGDGDDDAEDDRIEQQLAIWRQEKPGDPFVRIGTVTTDDPRELKAFLISFSRYAISY